jgi:EmrB/QacA subfamily drug resistance transporter
MFIDRPSGHHTVAPASDRCPVSTPLTVPRTYPDRRAWLHLVNELRRIDEGLAPKAVLVLVLASYWMIVLDISIVITALPQIHHALGFSSPALSWVQNAYLLTFGGLLLLGARAGDLLGRRRLLIVGLGLFTVGSLAVGAAQSQGWLIAARAVQGVGAALLAPSTLALLQTTFAEGPGRTRAAADYAAAAGVAATVGIVVGGMFAGWLSWRAGFFINGPIGVAVMIAAPRFLPETERRPARLDATGAVTSTVGMTALVYGIVHSADTGWTDPVTLIAVAVAAVALTVFVANERRAPQPIMPLRLFASRERRGAYAGRLLFLGAMVPFWFFTTQYLQGVDGYSPVRAGLAFLPVTVVNFVAAMAVPWLTRRFGNAALLTGGLAVSLIGMAWPSRLAAGTPYLTGIALPMMLIGAGQGGTLGPLTDAGIAGVAREDAGAAGGVTNAAHQLAGSLGLGILVAVFAAANSATLHGSELLAHRIAAALTAGAGLLAVALLVTLFVRPAMRSTSATTRHCETKRNVTVVHRSRT